MRKFPQIGATGLLFMPVYLSKIDPVENVTPLRWHEFSVMLFDHAHRCSAVLSHDLDRHAGQQDLADVVMPQGIENRLPWQPRGLTQTNGSAEFPGRFKLLHGFFDGLDIGEHAIAAQCLVDTPAIPGGQPGAAVLGAPEADMASGDNRVPIGFPPWCKPVAFGGCVDRIAGSRG